MAGYMRLRQICLVAPHLEPLISDIGTILGLNPPAGPDWQKSIRKDTTLALTDVEMESPEPEVLAAHWGKIIGVAVRTSSKGEPELKLPNAGFHFVKGVSDLMTGLTFKVV